MGGIEPVDIVVATVLAIASLRGMFLGPIREAFSLAGIASAYLAVRLLTASVADWLVAVSGGSIPAGLAPWVAGLLIAVFTLGSITFVGRVLRKGARAVGLGFADRLGGAVLGATEGALVVALLLVLAGRAIGWDHPALVDTRTVSAMHELSLIDGHPLQAVSDVASPPPSS